MDGAVEEMALAEARRAPSKFLVPVRETTLIDAKLKEVRAMLGRGATKAEVATRLGVSTRAVHVCLGKAAVETRKELATGKREWRRPPGPGVTLEELGNRSCRWPFEEAGEKLYCGAPTMRAGQPYCRACHERAWIKPVKKEASA